MPRRRPVNLFPNWLLPVLWFITASYADQHNTTFVKVVKPVDWTANVCWAVFEDIDNPSKLVSFFSLGRAPMLV